MNKKIITHICFDLDGTLVDSGDTILKSTKAALDKMKISYRIDEGVFTNMIGMHFVDIFERMNIEVTDFDKFIAIYKAFYFDFMDSSYLYPGVQQTLHYLNENNIKVSLLTTKVQDQAEKIIDHFNLRSSFHYLMGRRDGLAHKPSPEPLIFICNELKIKTSETLMVGDTELDIQCGKSAGAKTCGALYGYRTEDQLEKEKPDFLISGLNELKSILE
ncbi:MAG: HAD-IA family hydrolase [Ignavibacteriaceae bacterium]|nr:HAD-IA family hydrolase [Ignavibacteriaceae bacterium]